MKKIILPGIISGIIMLIVGFAISNLFMLFPQVNADYHNPGVMRSFSDPIMSLYFLYPFVLGIALAWFWNKAKSLFIGSVAKRGFDFAVALFWISTIPGMLISYSSFPLSFLTIVSWIVSGFINAYLAGLIFTKMNQ
jgi:hypothetical protein